jgi:hypothetical protein
VPASEDPGKEPADDRDDDYPRKDHSLLAAPPLMGGVRGG